MAQRLQRVDYDPKHYPKNDDLDNPGGQVNLVRVLPDKIEPQTPSEP